jgi:hypothetical protein
VAFAQHDTMFRFERSFDYPIESFTVNSLGELFLINANNQLKKIDGKGDSVGVFNMVTKYGKLSYVEAQNPWRTILFYKNFSTVVLLDKFLNPLTNINLKKENIFKVKAITSSYDNNLWLYDEQDNKLKKIDNDGKILFESFDMRRVLDSVPSPVQLLDADGFLYMYDPEKGLYTFDYYGALKNRLSFLHWRNLTVINKTLFGFDDQFFYSYPLNTLNLKQYSLPTSFANYSSIKIENSKIYVLKNGQLSVYAVMP